MTEQKDAVSGWAAKDFDPAVLAAFTTGVLMTEFSPVHEAAEWLMGHPVWTHELPRLSETLKTAALDQFPEMPTEFDTTWGVARDSIRAKFGPSVMVEQGSSVRQAGPLSTLHDAIRATGEQS